MVEHREQDPHALPEDSGEGAGETEAGGREEALARGGMPFKPIDAAPMEEDSAARIDRLLRALADAENSRRRADRTAAEAKQYAIGDFARDLLVVADNLQRPVAAAESERSESVLLEGVKATAKLLQSVLERHGVKKIEALDAQFDPKLHEAVMAIEDETRKPGTIVEVVEDGYMLHDRLLRPARVIVAKSVADSLGLRS